MTDIDLGRVTSNPLTEVRTVLSRAESALSVLRHAKNDPDLRWSGGYLWKLDGVWDGAYPWRKTDEELEEIPRIVHPDLDEMIASLEGVVASLKKWERTGRPRRRK
jgi:hypothetical protein